MPDDYRIRAYPPALDDAIKNLVLKNRENLIRATVGDKKDADELVELSRKIEAIRARDPEIVGAWGLGCGAGCRTLPGATVGNRITPPGR